MKPVHLNTVKWLQLCDQAETAALMRQPNRAVDDLATTAGRLTTVTPPHATPADIAHATAFRWACTAFGLADPARRRMLAPGLTAQSVLMRALLTPEADPARAALAVPTPPPVEVPPRWAERRDIGG